MPGIIQHGPLIEAPATGGGGGLPDYSWLVHFDAAADVYSDAGTTPAGDGDTVREWHSQVGSNHARQVTSSARPLLDIDLLNGHPALVFASGDWLNLDAAINASTPTPFTFFSVFERLSGYCTPLGGSSIWQSAPWKFRDNRLLYLVTPGEGYDSLGYPPSTLGIYCCYADASGFVTARRNGVDIGTTTKFITSFGTSDITRVGADGSHYGGSYGEILLTHQLLNSAQIAEVEAYLAAKWDITI